MGYYRSDIFTEAAVWLFNSSPPGQKGRHFADDIFKSISLKFVPGGPIDNKSALVQVMAWQAPSHYLN